MIKLKQILTEGKGDCYQAGGRLIMNFFGDKNHKLVHGMVNGQGALSGKRYGHCWVESRNTVLDHSNGRKLEVPTKVYYALGNIKKNQCKYYTPEEAAKWMTKKEHWGPWEMSGGVVMAEEIPDSKGEVGKPKIKIQNIDLDKIFMKGRKKKRTTDEGKLTEDFTGKQVAKHIKDITPMSGNIPNYFIKKYVLPNDNWKAKNIDPKSLLKTDRDFKEYFDGGEERYDQSEMSKYDLELELVIYKGTLLDGYSRAAYMIRNKIKKAYTYSHD